MKDPFIRRTDRILASVASYELVCATAHRAPVSAYFELKAHPDHRIKYTARFDKVKVAQSCPTLSNHMAYIVRGILQARILEWVDVPFSRGSSQSRDLTQISHIAGGFFTN